MAEPKEEFEDGCAECGELNYYYSHIPGVCKDCESEARSYECKTGSLFALRNHLS